jgi:hypothetical protein
MWLLKLNRWAERDEHIFFEEFENFFNHITKFSETVFILEKKLNKSPGEIIWYYEYILSKIKSEISEQYSKMDIIDNVNNMDRKHLASYLDNNVSKLIF